MAPPREAAVARLRFRNAGKSVVEKKYSIFLTRADAGEWMNANLGPRDFMTGHWRIDAIRPSFQMSRTTPAMMATMTNTTTKKTNACHNSCFLDTGSTAELAVADDDDRNDVNGSVEGDDMTRGERVNR